MPTLRGHGAILATNQYGASAPAVRSAFTADNVPAKTTWHQGFKVLDTADGWIVPFLTKEVATRVAAKAQAATDIKMVVVAYEDFYGYRKDET